MTECGLPGGRVTSEPWHLAGGRITYGLREVVCDCRISSQSLILVLFDVEFLSLLPGFSYLILRDHFCPSQEMWQKSKITFGCTRMPQRKASSGFLRNIKENISLGHNLLLQGEDWIAVGIKTALQKPQTKIQWEGLRAPSRGSQGGRAVQLLFSGTRQPRCRPEEAE